MNAANVLFPITNFFKPAPPDPTSFTSGHGGNGPGQGEFAIEGIDKGQDSLTQSLRSLSNYTGQEGMNQQEAGKGTVKAGGDMFADASHSLDHPLDLFRQLTTGDRSSLESVLGPEKDAITSQFDQIKQMFA